MLASWAWSFDSLSLHAYAAIVAAAFHFRVVLREEPWLARTYEIFGPLPFIVTVRYGIFAA